MRKKTSVVALVGVLAFGVGAARADFHFTQPLADAGPVHAGVPLRHRFAFVNQGPGPIEITEVRASCGCMRPRVEKRVFAQGEEGAVALEVHTLGQSSGSHTWHVFVTYRIAEVIYEIPLELRGDVVTEVSVQPAAVTVFAEAEVGHDVLVTDLREHQLSISSVQSSSPKLTARLAETYSDDLGRKVRKIHLEVADDYPEGRHEEIVDVITDDPAYGDLRVPVTIVKRSPRKLTLLPAQAELIAAPEQAVVSRIVMIRSGNNEQVEIERAEADDPAVICHWARGPGNMSTVRITVDRGKVRGSVLQTTVRVHVRAPVAETMSLPVSCTLQ